MQGNRPLPRVTPSRLLLRHAVARLQQSTNRISRGMGNGATYIGGNKGQPVSRHRHGRGHNRHLRHGLLLSRVTAHDAYPSSHHTRHPRPRGQETTRGRCTNTVPAARTTQQRLFVCHTHRLSWIAGEVWGAFRSGASHRIGFERKAVRGHHCGRCHNVHIRHGLLLSSVTGHQACSANYTIR